jgi:hypothetical protein
MKNLFGLKFHAPASGVVCGMNSMENGLLKIIGLN